ncbi:MAG: ribonuclease HII [Candidatus Peribacteraceae bacterium]|jgi:ribonuclease HII
MNGDATLAAGVDEAGRGALAGPVVAAACILPFPVYRRRTTPGWSPHERKPKVDCIIADSKQLTPHEREIAFGWIESHCSYGIGIISHAVIEAKGIRYATFLAMQRAVFNLCTLRLPHLLRIDGRDHFHFALPHEYIVRGDGSVPAIAAASIIAKVTRDRIMIMHHRISPLYDFAFHKGYGSPEHCAALRRYGPTAIHRRSFLSRILCENNPTLFAAETT